MSKQNIICKKAIEFEYLIYNKKPSEAFCVKYANSIFKYNCVLKVAKI